ncbi:MAG TPA: hypothetical protein VKT32_01845 [Chthonomonadaceae bacterium]|nr:hypothetical protein [Chthonomonadaceae bacterium]
MQDLIERTVEEVTGGAVFALLPEETQAQIRALSEAEVRDAARRTLTRPLPGDTSQGARLLLNPCLAVQWLSAFEELKLPRALRVFEPCAGSSEPVLLAAEIYSDGAGEYTTLNLNRPLAAQLRDKLAKFRMKIHIIEDNTLHATAHLRPESADVACFHHAINDILQTAVSEPRGMDTRTVDWWPNERQMIEWLAEEAEAKQLDAHARPALVEAARQAVELVRPGGFLLFDHWTWEGHRNSEWFPWELFCSLVPLAREWIGDAGLPVTERPLAARDPQWWMCLQKS